MSAPRPSVIPETWLGFHPRSLRILQFAAVAALLFVVMANCGQAFIFPLELELREGSSWLYVLAARAGVSIYDHQHVAFLNMNHGPLDPLLKQALGTILPFLEPAMVTRFFVVLLPFGLFAAITGAHQKSTMSALIWALGLHLFLLGLQPPHFLIGRSDPTALFFCALMVRAAASTLRKDAFAHRSRWLLSVASTSLLGSFTVLANWRFFPAVAAVAIAFAIENMQAVGRPRWRSVGQLYLGTMLLVGSTIALVTLFAIFRGDGVLYYRHFFGFFSAASGWGAVPAEHFAVLPSEFLASNWLIHLPALVAVALGVRTPALPRALQLCVWIPLLSLTWFACAAGFFLNHSGGGIYYFAPFYLLLVFHLVRAVDWPRLQSSGMGPLVFIGLFCLLPWQPVWRQAVQLSNSFGPAYAFLAETKRIASGERIHSEEYYFFKDRYAGEIVDQGDVVFKASATEYYGADLTETAQRYFSELQSHPPSFVITGGTGSPILNALLAKSYRPILRVPPDPATYAGPAETLYRLKAAAPSAPP